MQKLSAYILRKMGWKIEGIVDYPTKCILCVAPHTSNWDLILGKLVYSSMGRKAYFLIKKTWFFFPMNFVFKALGGIPVDRSKKTSLTEQLVNEFSKRDNLEIAITPEGTRKLNGEWKKGFYYIALEAKVPIIIIVLDYKLRKASFKQVFYPTGDVDKDLQEIKSYYVGASGKHPEKFSLEENGNNPRKS